MLNLSNSVAQAIISLACSLKILFMYTLNLLIDIVHLFSHANENEANK